MKHCDRARSCLPHQSPLALHSRATFLLHMLHSSSGMPCSVHHHSSCFVSPFFATGAGLSPSFLAAGSVCPQPPTSTTNPASSASSDPRVFHLSVMASSLSGVKHSPHLAPLIPLPADQPGEPVGPQADQARQHGRQR